MRWILTALVLSLAALSDAAPAPKEKPLPESRVKKPPVPDLEKLLGTSNWGDVTQKGREVFITGHRVWEATGVIRADRSILLVWTKLEAGDVYPGVYKIDGKELKGTWGHENGVIIEPDGTLSGTTHADRIYTKGE